MGITYYPTDTVHGLHINTLWGLVLDGWGLFNLVEGGVDHEILGIHQVRSGPHQTFWDVAFLAFGAAMHAGGWALQRTAPRPGAAKPAPS
ncbi:MAG: hypothetical protein QOF53_2604 [Nocardioidaceae bacterium]|nr:hypothetical protein [Nocardioidaceae bacterium]